MTSSIDAAIENIRALRKNEPIELLREMRQQRACLIQVYFNYLKINFKLNLKDPDPVQIRMRYDCPVDFIPVAHYALNIIKTEILTYIVYNIITGFITLISILDEKMEKFRN